MPTINQNNLIAVDKTKLPEGHLAVRIGDYVHPIGISVPTGIDTNDATATAGQMLAGASAYVKGEKVIGTINTVTPTLSANTFTVAKGYVSSSTELSVPVVEAINDGTTVTVPVGYIAEEQTFEVGGGSGSGSTSYYACASAESGTWTGYTGSVSNNVLSFSGNSVSLNYTGNAPEVGNMYLADGTMQVTPNGDYIPIPFVSLAGGPAGKPFGFELKADTDNIYSEVVYTLDAPDNFSYSDGVISGTLPGTTDTFTLTLLAEADGYISVAARVDITPTAIVDGEPFVHFPFNTSLNAQTGQHLTKYSSSNALKLPELTTFEGKQCAHFTATYDDNVGEVLCAAKTLEFVGITGSPTLTVAFYVCLENTMYGEWYSNVPDCVCLGKSKSTGGILRFSPTVLFDYDASEDGNLQICLDCWNFAHYADTGMKNDGKMHHCAFTLSGSALSIYFDGSLLEAATLSGTINLENSSLYFGKCGDNGYESFYGYLSDVKIWDRVLSGSEIAALANVDGASNSDLPTSAVDPV